MTDEHEREHEMIRTEIETAQQERGRIIDALWGPLEETSPGTLERDRDKGLVALVDEHRNGGIRVKMPWQFYVAIASIIVTAVVAFFAP